MISFSGFSQSHVGKITSSTGEDLPKVLVIVKKMNEATASDSSYTGKDGIFKIYDASNGDSIIFQLEGYITLSNIITTNKMIFSLEKAAVSEKLSDPFAATLSSAGKSDRAIGDIPASVVLITKDDIQALGYQNIEEILVSVPGLYGIEQHDWTGQGMNLGARGFYGPGFNNQMVILVNGVNMLEDHNSFYPLARLEVPIESIERIEVIRGPMSVIYGSGAFLGSINIITDIPINDDLEKVSGTVLAGKGGVDDFRTTAVIKTNTKLGHQSFSFGINNYAGPNGNFLETADTSNGVIVPDLSTKGHFNSERVFINYSGNFGKFNMNLSYSQAQKDYIFGFDDLPKGHNSRLLGGNAQVTYSDQLGKDSMLILTAKLGYFSHRNLQDYAFIDGYVATFESNAIEAEVNAMWLLKKSKLKLPIEITTGLYHRRAFGLFTTYVDDGVFKWYGLPENTAKENYGVILNGFYDITPKRRDRNENHQLQLELGVRMEYIPNYEIERSYDSLIFFDRDPIFIPRGGLIYKINRQNIVKLLYGQGIKQPAFLQLSDGAAGVSELKKSQTSSFELNYLNTLNGTMKGNRTWSNQINFSSFFNNLDNLINRASIPDSTGFMYISKNEGEIKTYGIELANQFNLNNRIKINISYTFQKSINHTEYVSSFDSLGNAKIETLENVAYAPVSLGYASVIWRISDHLSVSSKVRYVGSMFSEFNTDFDSNQTVEGYSEIVERVDGYWVADAQLSITNLLKSKLRIDLNVKNFTNTKFHVPYGSNTSWATSGMIGRGIWFMASAKYTF